MPLEMEEDLDLPEPLKHHALDECRVCGAELPYPGARLCDACRETLRDMERKKWLGENGPVAVFVGIAYRKFSVGIALTEPSLVDSKFPIIPRKRKRFHMAWQWNPATQKMELDEDPPEEVCWLFWQDRDTKEVKSKVFWGTGEALDYMDQLKDQGHTVRKAGIKIFPICGGERNG